MIIDEYDPRSMTTKHMLDNAIAKAGYITKQLGHHPTGWNFDYENDAATFDCVNCRMGVDVALNKFWIAYGSGRALTIQCPGV